MISKNILDELVPIPTRETLLQRAEQELSEQGFPITNFHKGGVFYTLLMIMFQVRIELAELAQHIVNNSFVTHAEDGWLELAAADYGKFRKQPQKAQGVITLTRTKADSMLRIKKGSAFKTAMDGSGQEYRYIVTADTLMGTGQSSCAVSVEAERPGAAYNVPDNTIVKSIIHLETIENITNAPEWLTREGSDIEEAEALRKRTQNAWSELATQPTAAKYKSICEAVPGVLTVQVIDNHPRGQGTLDIVVTSVAGAASEELLDAVQTAAAAISSPDDDILVRSATTVLQNVTVTLVIDRYASSEGLAAQAEYLLRQMMAITSRFRLHELCVSDINYELRKGLPVVQNVNITLPAADVVLEQSKVVVLGTVSVSIERA